MWTISEFIWPLLLYVTAVSAQGRGTWNAFGSHEYYVSITRAVRNTYSEAEAACESENATLALVKTQEVQDFIESLVTSGSGFPYGFFIGLRKVGDEYLWNDSEMLDFNHWADNEPTAGSGEQCVVMMGDSDFIYNDDMKWRNEKCDDHGKAFGQICQRLIGQNWGAWEDWGSCSCDSTKQRNRTCVDTGRDGPNSCTDGSMQSETCVPPSECNVTTPMMTTIALVYGRGDWAPYGSYQYYVSVAYEAKSYQESQNFCNENGGELAIVKSEDVQDFISSLVTSGSGVPYGFYIGLRYNETDEKHYWTDGSLLSGFKRWDDGEPNVRDGEEHCVAMGDKYTYMSDLKWHDYRCYTGMYGRKGLVCQRRIGKYWSDWSGFSGCGCDIDNETRNRTCLNSEREGPNNCTGSTVEIRDCPIDPACYTTTPGPTTTEATTTPAMAPTTTAAAPTTAFETETPTTTLESPTIMTETETPTTTAETEAATTMAENEAVTAIAETEVPTIMAETEAPTTMTETEVTTIMAETEAATTMADTEAPITVAETEAPTTIAQTEAPTTMTETEATTIMAETEAATTMAYTEAPITRAETEAPTTMAETEASTTMAENEATTTMTETEATTIMAETEAATTMADTEAPITIAETEAPTIMAETEAQTIKTETEAPTTMTETEATTTMAYTEATTIMAETEAATTMADTEATITVAETEAPSTVAETEASTIMTETEASINMAETGAPTTTTETEAPKTMEETEAPITMAESEAPTTMAETEAPIIVTETEPPISITETQVPITMEDTEAPITMAETEAPTTMEETKAPTTIAKTEAPTTRTETEEPTTRTETEAPTAMAETEAPTARTETEAPTTRTKTEAPKTTVKTGAPTTRIADSQTETDPSTMSPTDESPETSTETGVEIAPSNQSFIAPVVGTIGALFLVTLIFVFSIMLCRRKRKTGKANITESTSFELYKTVNITYEPVDAVSIDKEAVDVEFGENTGEPTQLTTFAPEKNGDPLTPAVTHATVHNITETADKAAATRHTEIDGVLHATVNKNNPESIPDAVSVNSDHEIEHLEVNGDPYATVN